jgi:hypothetical protein
MSPLFGRKPKLHTCFFCSELIPDDHLEREAHYRTHLIQVTDNNGYEAYTFKCPRCGLMDMAWGGGRRDPQSNGVIAIYAHLMQRHNVNMITR